MANSVSRCGRSKDRALSGPHGYAQIPEVVERARRRVTNFYADFERRLSEVPFVAGDAFSAADLTRLATVDFATRAFSMPIPVGSPALDRWYAEVSRRPSARA